LILGNPASPQHFAALQVVVLKVLEGVPRRQGGVRMDPVPLARARVLCFRQRIASQAGRQG